MVKHCVSCKKNVVWVENETDDKVCCYCRAEENAMAQNRELKKALETAMKWWNHHREEKGVTSGIEEDEFVKTMEIINEKV